jgi:HK97 family phage major capsid protein/HK97 family phage prohead protease
MSAKQKIKNDDLSKKYDFTQSKRAFSLDFRNLNDEKRTIELCFSSDLPVEIFPGFFEILSHDPGSVNLERLNDGAPLLLNHNTDLQIGVIESAEIKDGKGRAVVRFSEHSEIAGQIFKEVKDGIRKKVSVAYRVNQFKDAQDEKKQDVSIIAEKWTPYEISIVSIPADNSVGTDRELNLNQRGINKMTNEVTENDGARYAAEIQNITSLAKDHDMINDGMEFLTQRGAAATATEFKDVIMKKQTERLKTVKAETPAIKRSGNIEFVKPYEAEKRSEHLGLDEQEIQSFSLLKLIRSLVKPNDNGLKEAAAFEYEVSREAAKLAQVEMSNGVFIPEEILERKRSTTIPTANVIPGVVGGAIMKKSQMLDSMIDLLRNQSAVLDHVTIMDGLIGKIEIPRQTSGAAAAWVGAGQAVSPSELDHETIGLEARKLGARLPYSNDLLFQTSLSIENIVKSDIAKVLALKIDETILYGAGTGVTPRGIKNFAGVNAVVFSAANPTYNEIVALETAVEDDNAAVDDMMYLFNVNMKGHLKTAQQFAGTNGQTVYNSSDKTVNGYKSNVSKQVAAGEVIYGNFKDVLVGMWGGLEMIVDPYTLASTGQSVINAFRRTDFALRRPESFAFGKAA